MNNPLITVIVPVYNSEEYIDDCVKSIQNQSYDNVEIILVDDGSTDNTGKVLDEYAKQDKRIKVIHKQNTGVGDSRRAGIEASAGNYIAFVDDDDWVEPDYCSVLFEISQEYDADISACGTLGHDMSFSNYNPLESKKQDTGKISVFSNIESLERVRINNWAKLYVRKLFEKVKYTGLMHDDELTVYKLLYYANRVVVTERQLYNRRCRQGSITRSEPDLRNFEIIDALKERSTFYEDKGLGTLKIKVDTALVGTIARLKVKFRSSKIKNVKEIRKRLNSEMKDAVNNVLNNKKASYNQKIRVLLYYFIPVITAYATLLRNKIAARKNRV